MEPGKIVSPEDRASEAPQQQPPQSPSLPAVPFQQTAADSAAPRLQPVGESIDQPASVPSTTEGVGWQFHQEAQPRPDDVSLPDAISWTASEFIEHQKGAGWYALVAVAGLIAAALVYVFVHDKISTGIILFASLAFGLYAARKPRTQQYGLSVEGIQIGQRLYNFADFKVFSVADEGAIASIIFMPLKRFMPPLTVYVAPEMEDRVIDFLSQMLPFEEHRADLIERILRRIRF